ncbi:MAG: hypothetical protein AAFP70_14790 [Calditrichota bacterium]
MDKQVTKLNYSNGRALYLLWIGLFISWNIGYNQNLKVILAALVLLAATLVSFKDYQKGTKFLFWVIIAGMLYFLKFFPIEFFIGLPIGPFGIGAEVVMGMVAFIHYTANQELLEPYLKHEFWGHVKEEDKPAAAAARKAHFKRKYAHKSDAELRLIAEDEKYMDEAILAAKELLEERQVSSRR